jgi:hypothetical protein
VGFRLLSRAVSIRRLIGLLLAINVLLLVAGALVVPSDAHKEGKGVRVGIVFDIGGKNDKSFNEAAWRGLVRAEAELGIQGTFIEPTEGADRESALRTLASKKFDLVIGVGFIFGPDLERLAKQFPGVKFAGVDYSPSDGFATLANLAALRFREQEGSFLVGAVAGLVTRTKVVPDRPPGARGPGAISGWLGQVLRAPTSSSGARREIQTAVTGLLASIAIGSVLMLIVSKAPGQVWWAMLSETASEPSLMGEALYRATGIMLTGLAVALPLEAGLFNIGGEAQVTALRAAPHPVGRPAARGRRSPRRAGRGRRVPDPGAVRRGAGRRRAGRRRRRPAVARGRRLRRRHVVGPRLHRAGDGDPVRLAAGVGRDRLPRRRRRRGAQHLVPGHRRAGRARADRPVPLRHHGGRADHLPRRPPRPAALARPDIGPGELALASGDRGDQCVAVHAGSRTPVPLHCGASKRSGPAEQARKEAPTTYSTIAVSCPSL